VRFDLRLVNHWCVYVRTLTFNKMTFDLWHGGSPWSYLGQGHRLVGQSSR